MRHPREMPLIVELEFLQIAIRRRAHRTEVSR
jgi:hypothetical protein